MATAPEKLRTRLDFSNALVTEATAKGFLAQRVISSSERRWKGRFLVVEGKPCQIIVTRYHVSSPHLSDAVSIQLYLPRTDFPDFLIYVVQQIEQPLEFYVIPRGALSKDTHLSPNTLEKYRSAWDLLKSCSADQVERHFADLNWQLRAVMQGTEKAGLECTLIRRRKRWPRFFQTRVIIAGRRCSLYSLSRINPDYVALRKQDATWCEFQLYALRDAKESAVYVIPTGSIKANTSVSLTNEKLMAYRDNWGLLSHTTEETSTEGSEWQSKGRRTPPTWRPLKQTRTPKQTPVAILETIQAAQQQGLLVEHPHLASQYQLLISTKRCQIMQAKPVVSTGPRVQRTYVPLLLPKSDWAEFLIFYIRMERTATTGDFYIIPRVKLVKRTLVSRVSSWLREYVGAWQLLK
jgi:hypothetical protein